MRNYRQRRKARGVCASCPEPTVDGVWHCPTCQEKNRAKCKAIYYATKAAGKCIECGRPRGEHVRCAECHEADLVRHRVNIATATTRGQRRMRLRLIRERAAEKR